MPDLSYFPSLMQESNYRSSGKCAESQKVLSSCVENNFKLSIFFKKIVYSLPGLEHTCKFSLKSGLPPHLVMGHIVTIWVRAKGLVAREARAHEII